jgi:hypothetical protein
MSFLVDWPKQEAMHEKKAWGWPCPWYPTLPAAGWCKSVELGFEEITPVVVLQLSGQIIKVILFQFLRRLWLFKLRLQDLIKFGIGYIISMEYNFKHNIELVACGEMWGVGRPVDPSLCGHSIL